MISIAKLSTLLLISLPRESSSFSSVRRSRIGGLAQQHRYSSRGSRIIVKSAISGDDDAETSFDYEQHEQKNHAQSRRSILRQTLLATTSTAAATLTTTIGSPSSSVANAALGSLPEYSDTNAIFQGITIDVTDKQQYDDTIAFFNVITFISYPNHIYFASIVDIQWLGFGPETLSIPSNFELPVSSFAQYGGHASIHLRYDPLSTRALYKRSSGEFNNEPAPGDNIAYLQLGVPQYRISQMVKNGGNVIDAYGWVNVVSPAGLPVRGIVGIRPDPMMFLAINCEDVTKSEEFYARLGFSRQEYPYARLNQGQGQFEPPQPPKSVYVAPSGNGMGILLLQNKKRGKKASVVPNPVVRSLNVVYAPQEGGSSSGDGGAADLEPQLADPSSVPISFVAEDYLEKEIKMTALPGAL